MVSLEHVKQKQHLWARWYRVWLQIQIWWCHIEGKTRTACTAVKGCMVWCLWEAWNARKTLSRCVMPLFESSAVQWGLRYAWLRFPWRFLVPHYHRWILQIVFICLTFSSFLFCFVPFCFKAGGKRMLWFFLLFGVCFFGFGFFFFFLLVLTSCELFGVFPFWSEGRGKQLFCSMFVGRMSSGCYRNGFSYKHHP